ncbi:MAG: hypothetical protein COA31_006875 [Flavobacteriales bacterium]|nr:hypothetical protein [Flavobacteriales bacterium]
MKVENNIVKISYYVDNHKNSYFTHELLHAELLLTNFADFHEFKSNHFKKNKTYHLLFNSIIAFILNIYAHDKILPKFLFLGYNIEDFTSDFDEKIDIKTTINCIIELYNKTNKVEFIKKYIQTFLVIKDNNNPKFNKEYLELEKTLNKIDPKLYDSLFKNWNKWIKYEGNNNLPFMEELFYEITNWYNTQL